MKLWLILILYLFCKKTVAQQNNFTFNNYTVSNGLCDNSIGAIVQDSRGFMWFGSSEGLSRFDGTNFKNFFAKRNDSTALPGNIISNIYEYKKGHLLISANGLITGLNTYNLQFYPIASLKGKRGYLKNGINNTWFFSIADTCFILNASLHISDTITPKFSKGVRNVPNCTALDEEQYLLFSPYETFLYNIKNKKLENFVMENNGIPKNLEGFKLEYFDKTNNWIYYSNYFLGLYRYNLQGKLLQHWSSGQSNKNLSVSSISNICHLDKKYIWIATQGGGLNILNTETNEVTKIRYDKSNSNSIVGDLLYVIYLDKEKNYWIGSSTGLSKLNSTTQQIQSWQTEISTNDVGSMPLRITNDYNKDVYLSLFNKNLVYKISSEKGTVSKLPEANIKPLIWSQSNIDNNILFTGIGKSITYYNPALNSFRTTDFLKNYFPTSEIIILAFKTKNGDEWFSGNKGGGFVRKTKDGTIHVYRNDGPRGKFLPTYAASYVETNNGDVWLGVNKSSKLIHWDAKKDSITEIEWSTIEGLKGEPFNGINALTKDANDNIWVGFDGTGIVQFDYKKKTGTQYTIQNGLPSNLVFNLQFDGNNRLWIGTVKGLSCFILDENKFINFNKNDGLADDNFTEACSLFDSVYNKIWIAANTTLYKFTPDALLKVNKKNLPIFIDEIILNGKVNRDSLRNKFSFKASQNNIQFSFIAIDINGGQDIEYSYQLEGADNDWVFNGHSTNASYANLKSGKYTFKVRARHKGDTEWSEIEEPLTFSIATHWYKTWWFTLLAIALVAFVLWYSIRMYYLRKLDKQKAIVEKQQAVQDERNRIAADMHDDLGSGLTKITYLSHMAKSTDNKTAELEKINKTSASLVESMSEIIWAMKEENNALSDLILYIKNYALEYCAENNIACTIDFANNYKERIVKGENRRHIFLAIKEILHNVVKHANATKVHIIATYDKEWMITIKDNGVGINTNIVQNAVTGNGVKNINKRIAAVGGTVHFENNNGTTIYLYLPI